MKRPAAAIARKTLLPLAALLPLAGCAMSPGAWAYYDRRYDNGWEGYERPITYNTATNSGGASYGETADGRPYGNAAPVPELQYSESSNEMPDYASELNNEPRSSHRCNCIQAHPESGKDLSKPAAQDPSWNSTYYSIGP